MIQEKIHVYTEDKFFILLAGEFRAVTTPNKSVKGHEYKNFGLKKDLWRKSQR